MRRMRSNEIWGTVSMSDGTEWKIRFERVPGRFISQTPWFYKVHEYVCHGSSGYFIFQGNEVFYVYRLPYEFSIVVSREDIEPYSVTELPETDEWDRREVYRVYERRHMRIHVESVEGVNDVRAYLDWDEEDACITPPFIQRVTFTVLNSEEDANLEDRVQQTRTYTMFIPDRNIQQEAYSSSSENETVE